MDTYDIRIRIDIVPSSESPTTSPSQQNDGSFRVTIPAADAGNIDMCEQALLQAAYPSLRTALSDHLSALSKKKPRRR